MGKGAGDLDPQPTTGRGRVLITQAVRPLIQQAKSRIDVAVFFLTHTGLTGDLIAARRRGVDVRVILDATGARNGYTKHELLRAAGIAVKVENWGGKMHMKAAAIDGQYVITGSMNFSDSAADDNDENMVAISDPEVAQLFIQEFDRNWARATEAHPEDMNCQ